MRSSDARLSNANSTYELLAADGTFTGPWEKVDNYISVVVSSTSNVAGTLHLEFSDTEAGPADSTLSYDCAAGINEVHRLTITRPYYRTRYVNGPTLQTSFGLNCIIGSHSALSAPANLGLGQDADAIVARTIDAELDIAQSKRAGFKIVNKFGRNADIDTGTLPEDVWAGGGAYTGFPIGTDELIEVVSSSDNDTSDGSGARTVRIYGLDSDGFEQDEIVTLAGQTPVDTVNTYTRCNRMLVLTSGSSNTAFNAGVLTARHTTTTANVFASIPVASNQSQVGCYTIPAGKTGYLRKLGLTIDRSNSATLAGGLWVRNNGASPRLIRIFSASQNAGVVDEIYGGLVLPALTDIAVRVTTLSTSNTEATANFDIILIDD